MIDLTSEMVDFYHDTSITKSPNADNIDEFIEQQNIDIIRDNVDRLCQQIARLINFIDEEYNKIYSKDDLINRQ
ncbi:hypothetical protein EBQ34_14335 [Vandammella animalimorsus]|uniref:Uncharacterized protein n=2 Tax=Vandammella animalimorsus TaxID=2029117 RepID=A0A3M6R224_9BURK|nr:hypothetical protein EBQ34_14335 [Vandammella animalimorsus]